MFHFTSSSTDFKNIKVPLIGATLFSENGQLFAYGGKNPLINMIWHFNE
jgi:hypothetical protein